jgi:hypothetical protein
MVYFTDIKLLTIANRENCWDTVNERGPERFIDVFNTCISEWVKCSFKPVIVNKGE